MDISEYYIYMYDISQKDIFIFIEKSDKFYYYYNLIRFIEFCYKQIYIDESKLEKLIEMIKKPYQDIIMIN